MKIVPASHLSSAIGIIFMIFSAVLMGAVMVFCLQPKGKLSCSSFGSYDDIPSNWEVTMPYLDANHNGIPCETLYKAKLRNHE